MRSRPGLSSLAVALVALAVGCTKTEGQRASASELGGARGDACERLRDALHLRFTIEFPLRVPAGRDVAFPVLVDVQDPDALDAWSFVGVVLTFANGITGSRALTHVHELKATPDASPETEFEFVHLRTDRMLGRYRARASFTAFGGSSGPSCRGDLDLSPSEIIFANGPDNADIHPPVVARIEGPEQARLGEVLELRVDIADASRICTDADWRDGRCVRQPVPHVAFESSDERRVDRYDARLVRGDDSRLHLAIPLVAGEGGFHSGTWKIVIFNVVDVWGNAAADLPTSARREFHLVE